MIRPEMGTDIVFDARRGITVETENDATCSGFHSLDTVHYEGFQDSFLSNFEEILRNFTKLPKTQAIVTFLDRLRDHLQDRDGHDLQLSKLEDIEHDLTKQLYKAYREYGNDGSVGDMYHQILKDVEVATLEEALLGISRDKAINVPAWQELIARHDRQARSHKELFDTLQPKSAFNVSPTFYFSYYLQQLQELYEDDEYTIDTWNPEEGTIYFSVGYNYQDFPELADATVGTIPIWSLEFIDRTITCSIQIDKSVEKAFLTLRTVHRDGNRVRQSPALPLPFVSNIVENVVLTYDGTRMRLRDTLYEGTDIDIFEKQIPYALKLHLPLTNSGSGIREISHYNLSAQRSAQLFFLN